MRFKLNSGSHRDGNGVIHRNGAIIDSDRDLVAAFGQKFSRVSDDQEPVHGTSAPEGQVATPVGNVPVGLRLQPSATDEQPEQARPAGDATPLVGTGVKDTGQTDKSIAGDLSGAGKQTARISEAARGAAKKWDEEDEEEDATDTKAKAKRVSRRTTRR